MCKDPHKEREYQYEYRQRNKERLREYNREYHLLYNKSPEGKAHKQRYAKEYNQRPETKKRMREYMRQWRKDHPEYQKEYNQRLEVKEKSRERMREHRKKHPEYMESVRRWKQKNPYLVRLQEKRRRARKFRTLHSPYSKADRETQFVEQKYLDFYTDVSLNSSTSEDHIIPLSIGGPDVLENVVFCELKTNLRKNARPVCVFLAELVREGKITQEAAERKLIYLRERLDSILAQPWLSDWYELGEFERLIEENVGGSYA